MARGRHPEVSIRHADFLLFERDWATRSLLPDNSFNPPCGFFVVRTRDRPTSETARQVSFNPPCGFFVVRTARLVKG